MISDMNQFTNALQESQYSSEFQNMKNQRFQELANIKGQYLGSEGSNWSTAGETITTLGAEGLAVKGFGAVKNAVQNYVSEKATNFIEQAKSQAESVVNDIKGQVADSLNMDDITSSLSLPEVEPSIDEGVANFVKSVSNVLDMRQSVSSVIDNAASNIKSLVGQGRSVLSNASSELDSMKNGLLPEFNNDTFASRFSDLYSGEFEDGLGSMQQALTRGQSITKQAAPADEPTNMPTEPEEIEMKTFNEPVQEATDLEPTAEATASTAEAVATDTGTDIAANVAADAAAEATAGAVAAAGISASEVLGPLGIVGAVIGGIVSLVEGLKKENEEKQEEEQALIHPPTYGFTNPSAQFL